MDSFHVRSGAFESVPWTVLSIVGEEALSELYAFTLHVLARHADLEAASHGGAEPIELELVGQSVDFRMREHGIDRYGLVASARALAPVERGGVLYARVRLEIVPRAWLLTQRRNTRIFQHLYVHQIVSKVLFESGVNHRWNLGHTYPKRVYCTQYDETDFEFVTRLLAEEGILFFFEHHADFIGGPPPANAPPKPSAWDVFSAVAGDVSGVAGAYGGLADTKETDRAALFGGSIPGILSDVTKPRPPDEEADDPAIVPPGHAGPGGAGDVFVLVDQATSYPGSTVTSDPDEAVPLTLTLRPPAGLADHHDTWLSELTPIKRVRAAHVEVRDYDFRKPMLLLRAGADTSLTPPLPGPAPLEVYDHHGEYEKPEVNPQMARLHLEQHRADAFVLRGRGASARLAAGFAFHFKNATTAHLHEGSYAVIRIRHESSEPAAAGAHGSGSGGEGERDALVDGCAHAIHEAMLRREPLAEEAIRRLIQDELAAGTRGKPTYQNRFECVPASLAYRPPRPRRVTRNVTESATVVGPIGVPLGGPGSPDPTDPRAGSAANEIYTDRYGRVKVQFHWDREGLLREDSSCWVRVVQTWAGAGFGFQFIPRVGMEVLVTFLGGDVDRPVIVGSLYNATHLTPEPLPQRSTRSGIRTQSSPGGGGFNELSFEDAKGLERVYVHAQKDFEETVNDTHTVNVKNHQRVTVSGKQETAVGVDQLVAVGQSRAVLVGKNQSQQVAGNHTTNVVRNETAVVGGNALHQVGGVAVRSVSGDELTVVEGDRSLTVRGNAITQIGGRDADHKANAVTFIDGSSFLTATERVLVKAESVGGDGGSSVIRLECGESFIEIHSDRITLSAKAIELLGGDGTTIKGKDAELRLDKDGATVHGDPITLQTPKGSKVLLDGPHVTMIGPKQTTVQGQKIALNSGQSNLNDELAKDAKAANVKNLHLVFTHHGTLDKSFIAATKYRVIADDQVIEGTTGARGELDVWVPPSVKVVLVTLWANETYQELYPLGPLVWLVHVVADTASAKTTRGAMIRLRNLAYDPGTTLGDPVDDATRQALLEFQLDQQVDPTGELDDATRTKLSAAYGASS